MLDCCGCLWRFPVDFAEIEKHNQLLKISRVCALWCFYKSLRVQLLLLGCEYSFFKYDTTRLHDVVLELTPNGDFDHFISILICAQLQFLRLPSSGISSKTQDADDISDTAVVSGGCGIHSWFEMDARVPPLYSITVLSLVSFVHMYTFGDMTIF